MQEQNRQNDSDTRAVGRKPPPHNRSQPTAQQGFVRLRDGTPLSVGQRKLTVSVELRPPPNTTVQDFSARPWFPYR